jgi:ectoine hydroxylase-related dioxygenase (phytanoyl-CoA dioxygenase family)
MTPSLDVPFPALTPEQRYHFEVFGYVVVPEVLSRSECDLLRESLQRLKRDIRARPTGYKHGPGEAYALTNEGHHIFMVSIRECDPVITAYATHRRLVGMASEVIGGEARIVEINAHINSKNPVETPEQRLKFGFHLGIDVPYGTHTQNGLFHCSFVKTLTNLTDLGPGDGGTVVIAGSHKLDVPQDQLIAAAYADRSLIHQVIAPAGSTLLFAETLIHATGRISSDTERAIIVCGYGTTMYPYWDGGEMTPEFAASIPEDHRALFLGRAHWTRAPRYRKLSDPVDPRQFTLAGAWPLKR